MLRSEMPSGAWKFGRGGKYGTVSSGEIKRHRTIETEGADQRTPWTRKHGGGGWEMGMLILLDTGKAKRNKKTFYFNYL